MQFEQMEVSIADDFDLDKILASGQCFRPQRCADGRYRFITGGHVLYLRQAGQNVYLAQCEPGAWESVWCAYFDLQRDYAALRCSLCAGCESESFLCRALAHGAGIRILRQDAWETLVTFLISQRKSIPAIRTAVELLAQRFGESVEGAGETVRLFPTAGRLAAVPEQELRACGLGYRTPYVAAAARQVASGQLDLAALERLSDAQLFARLQQLEGVGKKVANCVCLYAYARTAMVPVDVWVERLIAEEFGGQDPFVQYGQNAGIVQQYLFCYKRDTARAAKANKR